MLLRFLAAATAVLMLFLPVCASAAGLADVSDLAAISQLDSRFDNRACRYNNSTFASGGCGPSSIANGLIASLGITDEDTAVNLTTELLDLLCYPSDHATTRITIGRMARLASEKADTLDRWPTVKQLMADYPGHVYFTESKLTLDDVSYYVHGTGETLLMIGRFSDENMWTRLCELSNLLYYNGYSASAVTLTFLSAGTNGTEGAFRSGRAGHYVTLYVPVQEFTEKGNTYLLDSYPRALEGEAFGEGEIYGDAYDFHSQDASDADMYGFRSSIRPQRVSPTIIRLTPQGDPLLKFRSVLSKVDSSDASTLDALNQARVAYLKTTRLIGTCVIFIAMYPDAQ